MNWITNAVLPKIKALVQSNDVPDSLWVKCKSCGQMIFHKEFEAAHHCCQNCGHHAPLAPNARFDMLFDGASYDLIDQEKISEDPLKFKDSKKYTDRLKDTRGKLGEQDAIAVAAGKIEGLDVVIAAFDFRFMGGSMGRAVGNAILSAAEEAVRRGAALITVPSTGGARMQEGILSLMQLPRTIIATDKLAEAGLPYIVLLAHPTTGGVTASFAMLGDIQIAEPGAIIGFAGRRVIEETVREKLPDDFQTAEYLQDHGMVDLVVPRSEQRQKIAQVISLLTHKPRLAAAE
ncbi:MAG: acetyl-CoA carboxylase, carboxyltransferase subunit beta [Candidatus Puniceispirillaceae bacterium]